MDIDALGTDSGASAFYTQPVMNAFDDHMSVLRASANNTVFNVSPNEVIRFKGDLYGLFNSLGIKPQYHYVTRRLNKLDSPFTIPPELTMIIMPDLSMVEKIKQRATAA